MSGNFSGHLSDETLAALDEDGLTTGSRALVHLHSCHACRRRRDELTRLSVILAQTGEREFSPRHDAVPSAIKRLRLRRNSIANANEFFDTLVALMRGLTSLFSLGEMKESGTARKRGSEEDQHE